MFPSTANSPIVYFRLQRRPKMRTIADVLRNGCAIRGVQTNMGEVSHMVETVDEAMETPDEHLHIALKDGQVFQARDLFVLGDQV